jgi:hypothetical protein
MFSLFFLLFPFAFFASVRFQRNFSMWQPTNKTKNKTSMTQRCAKRKKHKHTNHQQPYAARCKLFSALFPVFFLCRFGVLSCALYKAPSLGT